MKKEKVERILKVLERGVKITVGDRFAELKLETEPDIGLRAQQFFIIGRSLGETLEEIECPTEWKRFVRRKDCPKYLKRITTYRINAYYPRLSLPKNQNWVSIDKGRERRIYEGGENTTFR